MKQCHMAYLAPFWSLLLTGLSSLTRPWLIVVRVIRKYCVLATLCTDFLWPLIQVKYGFTHIEIGKKGNRANSSIKALHSSKQNKIACCNFSF